MAVLCFQRFWLTRINGVRGKLCNRAIDDKALKCSIVLGIIISDWFMIHAYVRVI